MAVSIINQFNLKSVWDLAQIHQTSLLLGMLPYTSTMGLIEHCQHGIMISCDQDSVTPRK